LQQGVLPAASAEPGDLDPLGGRIDARSIETMTGELLKATAQWLPQFAG